MPESDKQFETVVAAAAAALKKANSASFAKLFAALELSPYYDDDALIDLLGELRRCARVLRGTPDCEADT